MFTYDHNYWEQSLAPFEHSDQARASACTARGGDQHTVLGNSWKSFSPRSKEVPFYWGCFDFSRELLVSKEADDVFLPTPVFRIFLTLPPVCQTLPTRAREGCQLPVVHCRGQQHLRGVRHHQGGDLWDYNLRGPSPSVWWLLISHLGIKETSKCNQKKIVVSEFSSAEDYLPQPMKSSQSQPIIGNELEDWLSPVTRVSLII